MNGWLRNIKLSKCQSSNFYWKPMTQIIYLINIICISILLSNKIKTFTQLRTSSWEIGNIRMGIDNIRICCTKKKQLNIMWVYPMDYLLDKL